MKRKQKGIEDFFSKEKTYKSTFFITGFHKKTEHFFFGILKNNTVVEMGTFSEGISEDEKIVLVKILTKNTSSRGQQVKVDPGICVELQFSMIQKGKIVEPIFLQFRTDLPWEECTWGNLLLQNSKVDSQVTITSPDKPIWNDPPVVKDQFISYLHEVSPLIMPFLKNRTLTVLRFPHGAHGEAFYQKNKPEYAPAFITTHMEENIDYIVCHDLSTLMWLGNQLALEFHVPFNHIGNPNPYEIVFDLDPPSRDYFHLAIKAALEMKQLFDRFSIKSYPKISGGKGLQIHIPLMDAPLTYDDTRRFTSFIAEYIVEKYPMEFTVERMKKKRGTKLYIDYVQHWQGKTIICPYSTRGREGAPVAAPLYWDELHEHLQPNEYTIFAVLERIKKMGCPFHDYFNEKNESLLNIVEQLKTKNT